MRRKVGVLGVIGVGLCLHLSGCAGGSSSGSQPPPPAKPDPAVWINDFCGAILPLGDLGQQQAPKPAQGDLAAAKQAVSDSLGKIKDALSPAIEDLGKLGPAPEPAGEQAKAKLLEVFTPAHQQAVDAKAKLDAAPVSAAPVQEAATALVSVGDKLTSLEKPLADLQSSPQLDGAAKQSANCQKLEK
ncbi:hypothetical protein [Kibdelosporangium phytohabitans]|uniref:Small secreted protein n=1 Tax=Kibdelosporangium phytohabitans TaxID=860235 RepID=A0A0N9IBA7_9PSEU|nr:hypothetical protein [Kibdelosporangium phytohabitans]ALG12107.1 hypothetical protein AOZ06_39250 [Kibdelosporangium phytohabitans]MBE1463603.1 hypothetical protein [Kibdelosporangium phytohabitans]